ncbi:MAG: methionyl-tRNA formyltransferase [Ferruginibacter sp.]
MIEQKIKTSHLTTTADFPLTLPVGPRVVFMGTPDFAVASLDKLLREGCNIVGVITAPDKAAGRGLELQQSAVKKYATEKALHILQPEKLKQPKFLEALKELEADLQVVVAFRMLPEIVWKMPPMGTVNLHASLLPQYRGAAPINWAIINGEKETGLTTFKLQQEIDTGNILLNKLIRIGEEETAGELHDRMKEIGAELLLQTVKGLFEGSLAEMPQEQGGEPHNSNQPGITDDSILAGEYSLASLKKAPKIFTETCLIEWNNPVDKINNLVRGLSPFPAAFTFLDGKKLKIYKVDKAYGVPAIAVGQFETDRKTFLRFACEDGYISIKELQLEGKKKMMTEDFLRGYRWA